MEKTRVLRLRTEDVEFMQEVAEYYDISVTLFGRFLCMMYRETKKEKSKFLMHKMKDGKK